MENGMALVLESVFGKSELDAVSLDQIRELIAEFPSFNAGHYFLSCKLKEGDAIEYAAATRRTALYFNNPLWLQHLLDETEAPHVVDEKTVAINKQIQLPREAVPTTNETPDPVQEWHHTLNETPEPPPAEEAVAAETDLAQDNEALLNETFAGVNQEESAGTDNLPQPDPVFDDNPAFELPAASSAGLHLSDDQEVLDGGTNHVPAAVSAGLAAAAAELASGKPAEKAFDERKANAIVFEPYHTIDYFASQGIKLVLDEVPADSFGRQLKSFTEWLKTMKRLPVQPLTGKANETEAAEVRSFAAHSVEDRDIMTETMAEVLVKQGMNDNAIAIYRKLSLIYPLKSAYFAGRIEQLKATRS